MDEIGIPIINIYTDGFKSKTPVSGYDIVTHSLLKYLVDKNVELKSDFINVISFSENIEDVAAIATILRELKIKFQVLPRFSTIDAIRRASTAIGTVVLNPEEGDYLAQELQEVFNVPYIESEVPIGIRGTRNFLLKLGAFLNIENEVRSYIEKKEAKLSAQYVNDILDDTRVFIDASLSKINGYSRLITNLGGKVVGFSSPFVDLDNRRQLKNLDFLQKNTIAIIGNGQQFEKANELQKNEVDIYLTENSGSAFVIDEGVAVVSTKNRTTYGFDGVDELISSLRRGLNLIGKGGGGSIYKENFKKRSGNWYVKQEVS